MSDAVADRTESSTASWVRCSTDQGIAHVELARPEALNGLTLGMLDELVAVGHRLRRDRDLRGVLLSGQGRSFCAGLDFASVNRDGRAAMVTRFLPRPWRGTNVFQEACWVWRRLPVPVVAAVQGHCLGAGLQLAMAADLRVTSADATWSVLEGKWGLVPDMTGVATLARQVGMETAKRLTMTAEMIDGNEAVRLGLAGEVSDDPEQAARELLATLVQRSPDQLAAAKRLFDRSWTSPLRRTFAHERREQAVLLAAPNTATVRSAARERRTPRPGRRLLP